MSAVVPSSDESPRADGPIADRAGSADEARTRYLAFSFASPVSDMVDSSSRHKAASASRNEVNNTVTQLKRLLTTMIAMQKADFGNIQLYDATSDSLGIVAQSGFNTEFLEHFRVVRDTHSVCGRAMRSRTTVVIEDVQSDPAFGPHREIARRSGFRSVRSTPILDDSGNLLGMISTHSRQIQRASELDLERAHRCAELAADVLLHRSPAVSDGQPSAEPRACYSAEQCATAITSARVTLATRTATTDEMLEARSSLDVQTARYARAMRASGKAPELMLVELKSLLSRDTNHGAFKQVADEIISLAISEYYASDELP